MSRSEYPLTAHDGALIDGHAVPRWRRRRDRTAKSLPEAYEEAIRIHSDDVYGEAYLHSPTDTIFAVRYDGGQRTLKTVLRDDGDIEVDERAQDANARLSACGVCGNDYYTELEEACPWCAGTGVVSDQRKN